MLETITKNTPAGDLINSSPQVLDFLVRKGVCGIRIMFPVTGTLEQMALEKDFSKSEIEKTLVGLNNIVSQLR